MRPSDIAGSAHWAGPDHRLCYGCDACCTGWPQLQPRTKASVSNEPAEADRSSEPRRETHNFGESTSMSAATFAPVIFKTSCNHRGLHATVTPDAGGNTWLHPSMCRQGKASPCDTKPSPPKATLQPAVLSLVLSRSTRRDLGKLQLSAPCRSPVCTSLAGLEPAISCGSRWQKLSFSGKTFLLSRSSQLEETAAAMPETR